MKITDILSPNCVIAPLHAETKEDAIRALVSVLCSDGKCNDEQALLKAVFDREALRSTGIGKGLAVPHGKSDSCTSLVMSVGKPAKPVDFQSKDGIPADFIVLLGSPYDQTGPHIQALARISRLMLDESFRTAIARAESAEEIYDVIKASDASG